MVDALRAAGFVGVEQAGAVIFARSDPSMPEFTAMREGDAWLFSLQWPLRATPAQITGWNSLHPDAPIDVDLGETRLQFRGGLGDLPRWAMLVQEMVAHCTRWRRMTRQMDEGM